MRLTDARRWLVVGNSGSGKTTLARRIGASLGVPHLELDAVHWQGGWTANPRFVDEVTQFIALDEWVVDGFYTPVRPALAARAQVLVWLDPPAAVILRRVVVRTVVRRIRRAELWNGNREPPLRTFFTDDEHVIRWAATTLRLHGPRVRAALAANTDLRLVRIHSTGDADRLIARLRG
jgi:adenylate kinase family enzyme